MSDSERIAAMGESNLELVRRAFEALSQRDIPTLLEVSAPDVEFDAPATAALTRRGRSYRGHNGIMRYMRDVGRVWEELELIPQEYREAGDRHVVVTGRLRAHGRGGIILDEQADWLVELRGGKVVRSRPLTAAELDAAELPVGGVVPADGA
jgi:ketosteroid isomerase-like protein